MDNLSPTSPLVPGLGSFGAMNPVPVGAVDPDHPIDPTSPTALKHSNSTPSSNRRSSSSSGSSASRRSHRHKERPDSTYAGLSSRDLARMLVEEEIRTSHFSKWAQTLSSQLSQQKQRADDAERRATHAAVRLKEETEARTRLEQALKQKAEELKLYQVQLKKAQGEIYKAQDALAEVEKMRDEAEYAAAKARSIARRLREQRLVDIAREEGRRVGLKEGLARGQEIDYIDRGYAYLEGGAAVEEVDDDDDYYSRTTRSRHSPPPRTATTTAPPSVHVGGGGGRAPGITDPPEERVLNPMTVTSPVRMPSPEPSPQRVSQPVPAPTPDPVLPPRPASVASVGTRSTHRQASVPPDAWIPVSDGDSIRIPPAHEFSPRLAYPTTLPPQPQPPTPASPTPSPMKSPNTQPILIVPPPTSDAHHSDRDSATSATSYSPAMDRHESHHRRRRSSDSQTSTTISQMDILGPPASGRDQRTLSSITEERSSAMSSAMPSPNNAPSVRSLQPNPNHFQTNAAAAYSPSLRVPSIDTPSLHKSSSMSSDEYKFDVIPPSRRTSAASDVTSIPGVTTSQHGMLSAEDAHNRPLPDINTPPAPSPPVVVVSEPPPGFVPFGPSPAQTNRSPLPVNPPSLSPDVGWGFDFQLPSTHVEEPPTAPVIPVSLSSKSKKALSNVSGVSGSSKYTAPIRTATHTTTGAGGRNRRPPSATSSDDEVSSDLSSDNSLTTPPAQPGRLLTPIYGPIGLPPAAPGTGRIAPASLPTQTPGTGRANPANLPPTQQSQQSQNADGLPPPGAVSEPPAPATTGSTRGRGTGNRGRKRK